MSSEVRHLVDSGRPFPLVRLAGELDATTSGTVRSVLLDVLAGQPEAIVVDLTDLDVADPQAVGVLRDLRRDTAQWPAARLTLCARRDQALWHSTGWSVRADCADALDELTAGLGPGGPGAGAATGAGKQAGMGARAAGRLSLRLEPQIGAARRVRELITEACAQWGMPDLAPSACIVATEMVNNVVAHAHTSMVVLLAVRGDGMSVAVRDRSGTMPRFTGGPVAPTAYGGRGMLLIDSVARHWGSLELGDGKVVWAVLASETGDPETAPRTGVTGSARG